MPLESSADERRNIPFYEKLPKSAFADLASLHAMLARY